MFFSTLLLLLLNEYGLAFGQNTTNNPPQLLVSKLTHYQSVDSPFYDANKTIEDLADIAVRSSIARGLYLTGGNGSGSLEHPTDIESQLDPRLRYGFLAHLTVGSQDIDQYVYMDTGSNLLWINCYPNDTNVPTPLYDPKKSTTYEVEACDYRYVCDGAGNVHIDCNDFNYDIDGCMYSLRYASGSKSSGYLARETFRFGWVKTETLTEITFGCAHNTNFKVNGVLGLGSLGISLLSQYNANKFAYCFGDITDITYVYNRMFIGGKVQLLGDETPLIIDSYYYINLEGITIGNTPLPFDPKFFRRTRYGGGMLVDSGASYTFIPQVLLSNLHTAVINTIGYRLTRREGVVYNQKVPRLCYNGRLDEDLRWFPEVKLRFQDNAIMLLSPNNLFQQYDYTSFCLAIFPSEHLGTSTSILGNLMQQNFYVAFDLSRKKLSFKRISCKIVFDDGHGL